MGHVPHVYVPRPWDRVALSLSDEVRYHLERVLRVERGETVSYTDGAGTVGSGIFDGGIIGRGDEDDVPAPVPRLTLAVAAPKSAERCRMVVEKAAELGVDRLTWLHSRFSQGRPPRPGKAESWATSALQQSQGAWRLDLAPGSLPIGDLDLTGEHLVVADPRGRPLESAIGELIQARRVTVAIGPEGGFSPDEIPDQADLVSLGARVLRVETAAIAVAALVRGMAPG